MRPTPKQASNQPANGHCARLPAATWIGNSMKRPLRKLFIAIACANAAMLCPALLFAQVTGPSSRTAPGAEKPDLNDYWSFQDADGSATVLIVHSLTSNKVEAIFQRGEPCPHEGLRTFYLKGKFDPAKITLEGTMRRCTIPQELRDDCPALKLWDPPYSADGDTGMTGAHTGIVTRFRGTFSQEVYEKDSNTGKYRCTPKHRDSDFILTRVRPAPGGGPPEPPGPLPGAAPPPAAGNPFQQIWDSFWGNADIDEKIWDRKHDGPESRRQ
jgi:hypothetical protein